jgi:hypothetical protein
MRLFKLLHQLLPRHLGLVNDSSFKPTPARAYKLDEVLLEIVWVLGASITQESRRKKPKRTPIIIQVHQSPKHTPIRSHNKPKKQKREP